MSFEIFHEERLDDYIVSQKQGVGKKIEQLSDDIIFDDKNAGLVKDITQQFSIIPLDIKFNDAFVSHHQKEIPAEHFPFGYFVVKGKSYRKDVIVYHLPYSGEPKLLRLMPNPTIMWSTRVYTEDDAVCFEVINFSNKAEDIAREYNEKINAIKKQLEHVQNQVNGFNVSLPQFVESKIKEKKQKIEQRKELLASLGVPVKEKPGNSIKEVIGPVGDQRTIHKTSDMKPDTKWDVFVCHASEDKDEVARPLAERLKEEGLSVWYDEFSLKWGSSLLQSINRGIAGSRYGIVVLSPSFFKKNWPQKELDGLYQKMMTTNRDILLPIRHNMTQDELVEKAPIIADILNRSTSAGIDSLANEVVEIVKSDS